MLLGAFFKINIVVISLTPVRLLLAEGLKKLKELKKLKKNKETVLSSGQDLGIKGKQILSEQDSNI